MWHNEIFQVPGKDNVHWNAARLGWGGKGGGWVRGLRALLRESRLTVTVWKKEGGDGIRDEIPMMAVGKRARP